MSWRQNLVDGPNSYGQRARLRRFTKFREIFPDIEDMTVLDLGGTVDMWLRGKVFPKQVTLLNQYASNKPMRDGFEEAVGDACDPPSEVRAQKFDLVFSNSVLEHVGGRRARQQFADVVRSMAPRYWIQTPNRYFPVEPHYLFPGLQFAPLEARVAVVQRWPLVPSRLRTYEAALRSVEFTELIGKAEFSRYFPDARVISEKYGPWVKSFMAVKA